jgi:hypothetical protein
MRENRHEQDRNAMDQWMVISLRVVHILTGAAWVGGAFLLTGFILPRARNLGPVLGGDYLNQFLDHPWFSLYISGVEGLAVITGIVLYWNTSGGLQGAWMTSPTGFAFTLGGIAAIVALGISIPISNSLSKLYYLTDSGNSDRIGNPGHLTAFEGHHSRLARLGTIYTILLTVAVLGMASAQYLN